jgi:nicotinate-nucleotide adenylyltransferase
MIRSARGGIGIFGGTFNPIHLGHLRAAEEVVELLGLERMLFVPSASPPHKHAARGDRIAPAAQRLRWVRAAVDGNPRFEVDPLEIERGGASYTVDTLRALARRSAGGPPVFAIGCDAFAELGSWREPEELLALAHFAVMTRPPVVAGTLADWLPKELRGAVEIGPDGRSGRHRRTGTELLTVEVSALHISASDVRRRLREGRSVRYLLPEAVRESVEGSGVYA